jgi:hypothetical protein
MAGSQRGQKPLNTEAEKSKTLQAATKQRLVKTEMTLSVL